MHIIIKTLVILIFSKNKSIGLMLTGNPGFPGGPTGP